MNTWINVSRYHLISRVTFVVMPWGSLAFLFGVSLVATAATPPSATVKAGFEGTVAGFYFLFACLGGLTSRSLPFGLALGVSRRSYYLGTVLLGLIIAAAYGLALAGLHAIEGATDGWGIAVYFFRAPYLLAGPWTRTWLISFVVLTLLFAYGTWVGMIYRRWSQAGLLIFAAAQIIVVLAVVLAITWAHAWSSVGHALTKLTPAGLTGILALLAAILFAGGYATIRHTTV